MRRAPGPIGRAWLLPATVLGLCLVVGAALWEHQPLVAGITFAIVAAIRVTDRRRVAAMKGQLAQQIDALPLATIAFDSSARVITWNRTAEEMFGWRLDEVVGKKNPTVDERARDESDDLHARVMAGEVLRGVEVRRRTKDGRELELALYTAPIGANAANGFLVLYEDVSDRKRAERRYQSLVEALPLVTYIDHVDDDATGIYTSPQITDVLGYSLQEWKTMSGSFADLVHPDDRDAVMAEVRRCNRERDIFRMDYRMRHRDGSWVWVRDRSTVLDDEDGEPHARGFLLDITEQKVLEEQLMQSQKMDALGQFAGGIAHDFNNLLTAIGGYSELAATTADSGSPLARYLEGIRSATAEAASLTTRLLAFSRRDVAVREPLDTNDVMRATAELLSRVVREDIVVDLDLTPSVSPVYADPVELKQVVMNLVLNARDAMADGGTITLQTAAEDDEVVLRVRDDGSGMDADTLRRALEPFFTTKATGKGTGLGLSVAYGIVERLGGTLTLASELGGGTSVEVRLPACDVEAAGAPVPAPIPMPRGTERVLVVEDREVVRRLAEDVLRAAGFQVRSAASGEEALASDEPFDVLLTDVVMPGLSGPQLAARLRGTRADLPVVYMSGHTDDVLAADALDARTGFIRKPFTRTDLVRAIRATLDDQSADASAVA